MKKYRIGLYEKALPAELNWNQKFKHTKEAGYDFLEISIDETDDKLNRLSWSKDQHQEFSEALNRNEMKLFSLCLSGHRRYPLGHSDKKVRQKALDIFEKALNFAEKHGIRLIQLAGYDVYYEPSTNLNREYFFDSLNEVVTMAATRGILLGFETMETPFMDTIRKAMAVVEKYDNPYLGIYPDIGNLTNAAILYNHEVSSDLNFGKGHIFSSHIKESLPGQYRNLLLGEGHTNFENIIALLIGQGVRNFVIEMWCQDFLDWKYEIKRAYSYIEEIIKQEVSPC